MLVYTLFILVYFYLLSFRVVQQRKVRQSACFGCRQFDVAGAASSQFLQVLTRTQAREQSFSEKRLRSASSLQLDVPRTHRRTVGDQAFAAAGPTLWNSLPHDITDCV